VTDAPTRRRPASAGIDLDELAALEEQRAFLLRSLDDLDREHEAGDLDDDDYATLRTDYTARAAEVLHAIDDRRSVIEDAQPTQRGVRRVLFVAAVAIVAVVAGLAEARKLAPRFPDALAFSAINALWSQDLATAKRDLAVIDSLQLPADTPVLGYVDGMLRPALRAAEAASTSTTAPSGSSTTVPAGAVPSTTAAP